MKKPNVKTQGAILAVLTAVGAWLYRLRGGGPGPKLPRPVDQILFSSFPCIFVPALARPETFTNLFDAAAGTATFWTHVAWFAGFLLCVVWAVAWECTGHGGPMDLGRSPEEPNGTTPETHRDLERVEHLIYPWLFRLVPRFWYDATGLFLTGFVVTLAPGAFVAASGYVAAGVALIVSGGLFKVLGYMIGYAISRRHLTEIGEWTSGGLRWLAAGVILFCMILT